MKTEEKESLKINTGQTQPNGEVMTQDILIYEFEENYFIIQRGQQGKNPALRASYQYASENVKLFAKLPFSCSCEELGEAAVGALDNFDTIPPQYDSWENKELNKQLCEWLGTRYFATITKNSRLVQLIREKNKIEITPFDNHNKNPWYGPMIRGMGFKKNMFLIISNNSPYETIGKLILEVFNISTYNPDMKTEKKPVSLRKFEKD
jgi:hypothetical protein